MTDNDKIYYYYEAVKNISDELDFTTEEMEILKVIIKTAYDRQINETVKECKDAD